MVADVPRLDLPQGYVTWFKGKSKDDIRGKSMRAIVFGDSEDGSRFAFDTAVEVNQDPT